MIESMVAFVQAELAARAVPAHVGPMQAYLKTEMPFYGVKKSDRVEVDRALKKRFRPADRDQYEAAVRALWALPHREEKYLALVYARAFSAHITAEALPLYLQIVRDGAWWDLVDEAAVHLVGRVWLRDRAVVSPQADAWIADDDLWIRRTALIGQLHHKAETDADRLFAYCAARAHEREFFIRKAIGWALRQYGRTDPDAVRAFVAAQGDRLSGLSRREALKHL